MNTVFPCDRSGYANVDFDKSTKGLILKDDRPRYRVVCVLDRSFKRKYLTNGTQYVISPTKTFCNRVLVLTFYSVHRGFIHVDTTQLNLCVVFFFFLLLFPCFNPCLQLLCYPCRIWTTVPVQRFRQPSTGQVQRAKFYLDPMYIKMCWKTYDLNSSRSNS